MSILKCCARANCDHATGILQPDLSATVESNAFRDLYRVIIAHDRKRYICEHAQILNDQAIVIAEYAQCRVSERNMSPDVNSFPIPPMVLAISFGIGFLPMRIRATLERERFDLSSRFIIPISGAPNSMADNPSFWPFVESPPGASNTGAVNPDLR